MNISLIVAVSENGVIGKDGTLPWRIPSDLKYFKNTTIGHHIVLGRKNYEDINRPLPGRTNIIITRQENFQAKGCIVVHSLDAALALAEFNNEKELFICGGAQIYELAMPLCTKLYWTHVDTIIEDGDIFFPEFDRSLWKEVSRVENEKDQKNQFDHDFIVYKRI